jgi:WbqC-like protein family
MKLAIMQPYLFPYLGYWQVMHAVDKYVIYDDVQFMKNSWINRNNILLGQQKHLFTIPLADASSSKQINEVHFGPGFQKFEKTLAQAYAKAPHKDAVLSLVRAIGDYDNRNVARFLGNSFTLVNQYLGVDTELVYSSAVHQNRELRGHSRVLDICHNLGATEYINAIGGQTLYSKEDFNREGINLSFLKTIFVPYKQLGNEFIPGLSILDVLMFNPKDEVCKMLESYELI